MKPRVTAVPLDGVTRAGLRALRDGSAGDARRLRRDARWLAAEGDPETDDLAVLSAPQSVDSLATVGVTWAARRRTSPTTRSRSPCAPRRAAPGRPGRHALPRRARPRRRQRRGPAQPPGHRPGVRRPRRRRADQGRHRHRRRPGRHAARPSSTRARRPPRPWRSRPSTPARWTCPRPTPPPTRPRPARPGTTRPTAVDPATDRRDPADDRRRLAAGAVTAKPMIYSRAQWGADERMRDKSLAALRRGARRLRAPHGQREQLHRAPRCPRSSAASTPTTRSPRGWSDVGYNFLVDRFGRIWEGRYGGVDRPVVGAHTLGYNDDAFAMSAIGNFETAQPSAAMLDAYGRLFAWKLSLHGVSAGSTQQWVTKRYLPAINGHRDVGQTACPGKYLYAQIPTIRHARGAATRSPSPAGPADANLVGIGQARRGACATRPPSRATCCAATGTGSRRGTGDRHRRPTCAAADRRCISVRRLERRRPRRRVARSGAHRPAVPLPRQRHRPAHLAAPAADEPAQQLRRGAAARRASATSPATATPTCWASRAAARCGSTPATAPPASGAATSRTPRSPPTSRSASDLWNARRRPRTPCVRRSDGALVLYPGNGPGGLTGGTAVGARPPATTGWSPVGDVTGDGRADLLVRDARHRHAVAAAAAPPSGFGARRRSTAPATCAASTWPAEPRAGSAAQLRRWPAPARPAPPSRPRRGAAPTPCRRRATSGGQQRDQRRRGCTGSTSVSSRPPGRDQPPTRPPRRAGRPGSTCPRRRARRRRRPAGGS